MTKKHLGKPNTLSQQTIPTARKHGNLFWPHPAVFRVYPWLCVQESLLEMYGQPHLVSGNTEPVSAAWKTSTLVPVPSLKKGFFLT